MAVRRVRPEEEDVEAGHSSDLASDEELETSHADFKAAMATKIGGRERKDAAGDGAVGDVEANVSHQRNSAEGMEIAQDVWATEQASRRMREDATLYGNLHEI